MNFLTMDAYMLKMERISSRKNGYIAYLRQLASDGALRRDSGETVLDGEKLLGEALASGCEVTSLLAGGGEPCRAASRRARGFTPHRRNSWPTPRR